MKKGVKILHDDLGSGETIVKGHYYQMAIKMWLKRGDPIVWSTPIGLLDRMHLSEDKTELIADYRIDREYLFSGLLYGIEGMRIGGKRKLKIAPHLAFREKGIEGMIPPNALLIVEVKIIEKRS